MSQFVVSARKYRPDLFDAVLGQEHITQTLKNAILKEQLAQAFLFCGPRGVGKTTCARILAKTINCTQRTEEGEACQTCSSCLAFEKNASYNIIELDAASNNSVEDIRNLIEQVHYLPPPGTKKIYIIDEVHMLSNQAFNAFLKTLEEPPNYAIFILATTEKHKIIPTILSRCQIFDFNRVSIKAITEQLAKICNAEAVEAEDDALHLIAEKADGGMRDALSMFDVVVSFSGNRQLSYKKTADNLHILDHDYYFKVTEALQENDTETLLLCLDEIIRKGFDAKRFLSGLGQHMRDLMVCKQTRTSQLLEASENVKAKYMMQSVQAETDFLVESMRLLNECELNYNKVYNARLQVEMTLLQIALAKKKS